MAANKYVSAAHLIGSALTKVNSQKDPALWEILQALKGLVSELQANTAQIEARLNQLEGGEQKIK